MRFTMGKVRLWLLALSPLLLTSCVAAMGKVLELSDRFLPLRKEGMWLMQFYAPWCGHCKKLEPIWKHVAQSLEEFPIRVGRVDCTRFSAVAKEFDVRGFPTIMFLKGEDVYVYEGDRSRADIVAFAHRVSGPPVKEILSDDDLDKAKQRSQLFFVYVGQPAQELWNEYYLNAKHFQRDEFMYSSTPEYMGKHIKLDKLPAVYIYKDSNYFHFVEDKLPEEQQLGRQHRSAGREEEEEGTTEVTPDEPITIENSSLSTWITRERFPLFVKITRGRFGHILATRKLVVIAVLEENKLEQISPEMEAFRDMVRGVVESNPERYEARFQFGWTGLPDLANSVAMESLEIPSLLVVNADTFQHYLPQDDPAHLTPEAIEIFLDSILAGSAPSYGGSSWTVRLYRAYYEARTSLTEMWRGNPVLTALLLGLPLGFLSLIFYSICCADIMDADEEEEEDEDYSHEKTE